MSQPRELRIVIEATDRSGGVARDIVTDERHNLCYRCGLPADEHTPACPDKSETMFTR